MSDHSNTGLGNTSLLGSAKMTTVTGFFDSRDEAESAAERLRALGLGDGQVQVTQGSSGAGLSDAGSEAPDTRGFFERLGDFLFPDEDRDTFAEGLSRGGYLVTATGLSSEMYDMVMDALEDAGAVDIDERAASWRAEGWTGRLRDENLGRSGSAGVGSGTGYGAVGESGSDASGIGSDVAGAGRSGPSGAALGAGGLAVSDSLTGDDDGTLPVVEERLRVGKRDTSHGRVRVRSYVVEEPVSETVRLEEERVEVERRPVDRPIGSADEGMFRERSIEAEEYREEAVIAKEARVVEEVALRRKHDSHEQTISDTLRRTEVEIDDARGEASGGGFRSGRAATEVEVERGSADEDEDIDATGLTERDVNRP